MQSLFLNSIICLLFLFNSQTTRAQSKDLGQSIAQLSTTTPALSTLYPYKNEQGKRSVARTFFVGYKRHFSHQDVPGVCNFNPSCSEYGILAVKKYGGLKGILITFDRLSRCNPFIHQHPNYSEDSNGKYIDVP